MAKQDRGAAWAEIRRLVTAKDAAERWGLALSHDKKRALCPWHDDHDPSLSFYNAKGIGKCKCHVCESGGSCIDLVMQLDHCDAPTAAQRINEAFNLHLDLGSQGDTAPRAAAPAAEKVDRTSLPGMTVHTAAAKPVKEKPREIIDWDHPVAHYDYVDQDGKLVYQVIRLKTTDAETGKVGKTFRQRRPDGSGWIRSVPPEAYDAAPIYHLPDALQAIREGRPLYIVEGEKDVETMRRLGFAATTNARGAGQWIDAGKALMAGADVIILPDSDPWDEVEAKSYKGQKAAWALARDLLPIAKRVRLVDLKAAWPDMPAKGDITDMVDALGDHEALQLLAQQEKQTRTFDPDGAQFWLPPVERAKQYMAHVPGYTLMGGKICQYTGDGDAKPLANFFAIPVEQRYRDDGIDATMSFTIDGWADCGRKRLPRVTIPAGRFESMSWITESWGLDASLMPGSTVKDKVRWAIKECGRQAAVSVTEYIHTGWRKIDGRWCYLYHGGAIGADGITVSLGKGSALTRYRVDGQDGPAASVGLKDACRESHDFLNRAPIGVSAPLLAMMYLAPLREWLASVGLQPSFVLYLEGETGSKKSTITALALSHFGNFNNRTLPASFNDTKTAIQVMGFRLKDVPLVIDNYHPSADARERRSQQAILQTLALSIGDGAARNRGTAEADLQESKPPRCLAIVTGEQMGLAHDPGGLARFVVLQVGRTDVFDVDDPDDQRRARLTMAQKRAADGWLQKAMRGYIEWLIPQAEQLPGMLQQKLEKYRTIIGARASGLHSRAPESLAQLCTGFEMMCTYFISTGAMTPEQAATEMNAAMIAMIGGSKEQSRIDAEQTPGNVYMDHLHSLITTGRVGIMDIASGFNPNAQPRDMIGWRDLDWYYIQPTEARREIAKACREEGEDFTATPQALNRDLERLGLITDANRATIVKRIGGKNERVYRFRRADVDGSADPDPEPTQLSIDDGDSGESIFPD